MTSVVSGHPAWGWGADGRPLGAQVRARRQRAKADWLVVEEITQLDMALWADLACVGLNADVKFLCWDFRHGARRAACPQRRLAGRPPCRAAGSSRFIRPHALAQERLHLGSGVPILRALGADHPVPLGSRSCPRAAGWGGRVSQQGLHLLPDTCSSVVPRHGAAQLVHRQPVPALIARTRVPPAAPPAPPSLVSRCSPSSARCAAGCGRWGSCG